MKRLLLLLLIAFILAKINTVSAAGQPCCPQGSTIFIPLFGDANLTECQKNGSPQRSPMLCYGGEKCFKSGFWDSYGVCIPGNTDPTKSTCCDPPSEYGSSSNQCLTLIPGAKGPNAAKKTPIKCTSSQSCYNNYCIDSPVTPGISVTPKCPPGKLYVYTKRDTGDEEKNHPITTSCYLPNSCAAENTDVYIDVENLGDGTNLYDKPVHIWIGAQGGGVAVDKDVSPTKPGEYHVTTSFNETGKHTVELSNFAGCKMQFEISSSCAKGDQCTDTKSANGEAVPELINLCDKLTDTTMKQNCRDCFDNAGSWTAIGCIKTDPASFIKALLGFGAGAAGGIAFLMIIFGGFQIITSSGDPERLTAGRELVSAAIMGLLFIIFSLFILRLVGVTILKIPGFG